MPEEKENSKEEEKDQKQDDGDLNDMLQELRILLQGAQVLNAFLIILPFNQGFERIDEYEKWVFIATFICSVASLVLLTAPAAHHRLVRPLIDREKFKEFSTRMIIVGLVPLSLALALSAFLVVAQVFGPEAGIATGIIIGVLIAIVWWFMALLLKQKEQS